MVIIHLCGLGGQSVASLRTMKEHDVVLNTKGEPLVAVHHGSQGDIGKGEIDATLTDAASVEMLRGDGQLGRGKALAHFLEFAAAIGSETVVL